MLHGGFVPDEGDDDIAALGGRLLLYEDVVAAHDAGFDHRITGDAETEHLTAAAHQHAIDAHRIDYVLFREERQAGGDTAEDLDLNQVIIRGGFHRFGGVAHARHELESAALHVFAAQVTFALEGTQVIVDAVGRTDAHVLANLAERWRVATFLDRATNEVQGLFLAS